MSADLAGYLLSEARGWLADCQWADVTPEDILAMPAATITRAVAKHYDGGIRAFILAST